jgi:hypothetical protein
MNNIELLKRGKYNILYTLSTLKIFITTLIKQLILIGYEIQVSYCLMSENEN